MYGRIPYLNNSLSSWATHCSNLRCLLYYTAVWLGASPSVPLTHSLHLCPSFPHLKHLTTTILTFLTILSSAPHCITLFLNTSNLFWETTVLSSSSFSFLQFQAPGPNPLQHLHNFPFLSSNSALNLARARFSLSRLLMRILYWVWDIVATSLGVRI